jgi:hypothetical protein
MCPAPSDDEERDIADDPLLSAINADLGRADNQTDNRLLFALAAIIATLFMAERLLGKNSWLEGFAVVPVIGAIGFTIYSAVRRKTDVAAKYGLICPACSHKPSPQMVLSAARTRRCRKCGAQLNG